MGGGYYDGDVNDVYDIQDESRTVQSIVVYNFSFSYLLFFFIFEKKKKKKSKELKHRTTG